MRVPKLFYFVVLSTLLSSCFKDEPLNAECDIKTAWVHTDNPTNVFFNNTDTLINVLSDAEHIVFRLSSYLVWVGVKLCNAKEEELLINDAS